MNDQLMPTHTMPGGFICMDENAEDGLVNDSLGTINWADSTGSDEEMETGEAKVGNWNTRED
jgi:hypothetical protein